LTTLFKLTDAVEFTSENLQDHESEAELAQGGADVGALEGTLGGADFDEFLGGEDDGAGAVEAEVVAGGGVAGLWGVGGEVRLRLVKGMETE
jgi:hypothetical protein